MKVVATHSARRRMVLPPTGGRPAGSALSSGRVWRPWPARRPPSLRERLASAVTRVAVGDPLSAVVRDWGLPAFVSHALYAGEGRNQLPEALARVADRLEAEAHRPRPERPRLQAFAAGLRATRPAARVRRHVTRSAPQAWPKRPTRRSAGSAAGRAGRAGRRRLLRHGSGAARPRPSLPRARDDPRGRRGRPAGIHPGRRLRLSARSGRRKLRRCLMARKKTTPPAPKPRPEK